MNNLKDIPTDDLIDQLALITQAINMHEQGAKPIREELLRRQKESGELEVSHNGWLVRLKRSPFSEAWLKREYGYELSDLPEGCVAEKVVPDIQWDKVTDWLGEVKPSFTIQFQREKVKV